MQITFLGTTCMVPTKERNHTGIFMKYQGEAILVDCGEGTQRQIKLAGHRLTEVTKLLITHWHGDHVLGIPGLIQSLGSSEYSGKLKIYGPVGTKGYMEKMLEAFVFDNRVDFEVHDVTEGKFIDEKGYSIEAYGLEHGVRTIGFRFVEKDRRKMDLDFCRSHGIKPGPLMGKLQKGQDITVKGKKITADEATTIVKGKIIAFVLDTVYCEGCLKIAQDADLLISESAFHSDLVLKAEERKHLTSRQAAEIAQNADVKRLVLTHFSTRYKDVTELEEEARTIFPNTSAAYDLMKVKV